LAASSVAAEPLVNFLKRPGVINPRDKVTGVLHHPRLPSGPTGVKRIPYWNLSSIVGRRFRVVKLVEPSGACCWPRPFEDRTVVVRGCAFRYVTERSGGHSIRR